MEIATPEINHSLTLENRVKCAMTGIKEVLSYSPAEIALESDGSLSLTGKINAIRYDEKKPPRLRRIFK